MFVSVYVYICEEIERERDQRIVLNIFGDKLGINLRGKIKKKVEIEKYYFLGGKNGDGMVLSNRLTLEDASG